MLVGRPFSYCKKIENTALNEKIVWKFSEKYDIIKLGIL